MCNEWDKQDRVLSELFVLPICSPWSCHAPLPHHRSNWHDLSQTLDAQLLSMFYLPLVTLPHLVSSCIRRMQQLCSHCSSFAKLPALQVGSMMLLAPLSLHELSALLFVWLQCMSVLDS